MNTELKKTILECMEATSLSELETIQTLWSGYGKIVRLALEGAEVETVILKHIVFPTQGNHPRGWNTSLSHQRKVRSYEVEMTWYSDWSASCMEACRVPRCFGHGSQGEEQFILLEDLDEAGFPERKYDLSRAEVEVCLRWLAQFHATYLFEKPSGLWDVGTYWHLETRPDEWEVMEEGMLKQAASAIDQKLNSCRFQTFVHGDAKVANFCFAPDGRAVAAVDFQYIGGGCGMKDVTYFLSSCLDEMLCELWEEELLTTYFTELKEALHQQQKQVDIEALEVEWREMYPVAWADFYRFLLGWMPGHWKINGYSQRMAHEVARTLQSSF